jgi:TfoX/Sxy family transcriptional regulator of competence genes
MSTSAATIDHLLDLLSAAGNLSARKMFGEYALYLDGKVVALVCDDTLFLKPTPGALSLLPDAEHGAPYPGAKPYLVLTETLDNGDLAMRAIRAVASDLPPQKPKKPKKPKAK